jgi:hypothetical protein
VCPRNSECTEFFWNFFFRFFVTSFLRQDRMKFLKIWNFSKLAFRRKQNSGIPAGFKCPSPSVYPASFSLEKNLDVLRDFHGEAMHGVSRWLKCHVSKLEDHAPPPPHSRKYSSLKGRRRCTIQRLRIITIPSLLSSRVDCSGSLVVKSVVVAFVL